MNKIIISLIAIFCVSCTSVDNFRDGLAHFVETEERRTKPDRIRIETEYVGIPSEFYATEVCPPPVSLTPQEIARLTTEGRYNELFVAPLYANNESCYLGMRRIERYNEENIAPEQFTKP